MGNAGWMLFTYHDSQHRYGRQRDVCTKRWKYTKKSGILQTMIVYRVRASGRGSCSRSMTAFCFAATQQLTHRLICLPFLLSPVFGLTRITSIAFAHVPVYRFRASKAGPYVKPLSSTHATCSIDKDVLYRTRQEPLRMPSHSLIDV